MESNILRYAIMNAHLVVMEDEGPNGYEWDRVAGGYYCDRVAEWRTLTEGDAVDPAVAYCEWCGRRLRLSERARDLK